MQGIECITHLQKEYGDKIQILPGSGMNASNAKEMLEKAGVNQIHSSCKSYCHDVLTTILGHVSYAYLDAPHELDYDVVDAGLVKEFGKAVCQIK